MGCMKIYEIFEYNISHLSPMGLSYSTFSGVEEHISGLYIVHYICYL